MSKRSTEQHYYDDRHAYLGYGGVDPYAGMERSPQQIEEKPTDPLVTTAPAIIRNAANSAAEDEYGWHQKHV